MSNRELVTAEELVEIINRELKKYWECQDVIVAYMPWRLAHEDKYGCNWKSDDVVFRGPPGAPQGCKESGVAKTVIADVAARYNLI